MPNSLFDKLMHVTKGLYPNGKAFQFAEGGVSHKLHKVLVGMHERYANDASKVLKGVLPDNDIFDEDDATAWERVLGIYRPYLIPLAQRVEAIKWKMGFLNTDAPRQYYKFIEKQLRDVGFNVRVYENNFGGATMLPEDIFYDEFALVHGEEEHGEDVEHNGFDNYATVHDPTLEHGIDEEHGGFYAEILANHLDPIKDEYYPIVNNIKSSFYVAGDSLTTYADIPTARKYEFRQMLLQIKPLNTFGILLVNYN